MNMLYRACASREGYQSTILRKLYDCGIFDKCTVITQTLDNRDVYPSKVYHEIKAKYGYACTYDEICSIEDISEVSEDVLIGMSRYESTALNMTCRNHHMHIMYYDEMYKEYMIHVKFWNYILDNDKIGFVFMCTTPHCTWEYVIYALAKTKGIPVLIETVSNIPGYNEVGTSISRMGLSTKICFNNKKYDLIDKNIHQYIDDVKRRSESLNLHDKQVIIKEQKRWVKTLYYKPLIKKVINMAVYRKILDNIFKKNNHHLYIKYINIIYIFFKNMNNKNIISFINNHIIT